MACPCPTTDHALLQDLGHASVLDAGSFEAPEGVALPGWAAAQGWELRRCETCGTWWFTQLTTTVNETRDRSDETRVLSVRHDLSGKALRCADEAQARLLVPWYPALLAAAERFRRAAPRHEEADVGEALAAHAALRPLLERHPGAHKLDCVIELAERVRHWRAAEVVVEPLRARMQALVERLKKAPSDGPAREELAALQATCRAARSGEAEPDWHGLELPELWTVTLAPVHAAWWERQQLLGRVDVRTADAPTLARLRALSRTIVGGWEAFLREVRCPTPAIELRLRHLQLRDLAPQLFPKDAEVWHAAEEVAMRIRTLMARHGIGWEKDQILDETVERRLGLPATCDRERFRSQIKRVPPRW